MVVNTFLILLNILWLLMSFFITLHVLAPLHKMGWLGAIIDILLKQLAHFLIHGEVPQHFLGDVILTAYYLINCMTSSILNKKNFHFILFLHESVHSLPLKVFGSTCFVHNFSPHLDCYLLDHTNVFY